MGRFLGVDYGRAKIGLSHSDERKILASPLVCVQRERSLPLTLETIKRKIAPLAPFDRLVVGHPLLLSGKEGEMALEAKAFAEALSSFLSVPYVLWDERLSSCQAEKLMKEGGLSRKERSGRSDVLAAVLILQNYLDFTQFSLP